MIFITKYMANKLFLSSEQILEKIFPGAPRGYNALAVDQYLDTIIKDYKVVEANVLISQKEIDTLNKKVKDLEKTNEELVIENAKLKQRFSNIKSDDVVTSDNMHLIKRINALETFLYKKGFDPKDIK